MMASIHALQEISRMKRDDGLECLSSCFYWTEFDGDDKRQYLHQEFVYENVMLAITRGLSWSTVAQVANITKDLLPKLKGLKPSDVICLIKDDLSQIEPRLSAAHHAVLLDFIVKTYVPHQWLYQAFLNGETSLKHISCELEIESPPHPQPLCEGSDVVEWEQQRTLKDLRLAQSEIEAEIEGLKEKAEAQMMATLQASLNSLPFEGRMSKQEVEELLSSFLQSQGEIIMESLMKEACLTENLLQMKLRHFANQPVSPEKHSVATPTKSKKK
ncbi:uncharacterized protein C8orf74 homolog [Rhinichthys klamathensis goyatoka]|uniref:uncharacterized protein C8orf74 homolog n=1 Tax=Rhinichthys klamathensis goyatoka TaxID=3034132 RepID=UPI0024B629DF|nr:uncharacterized protein C8orf74 homolog [Rhinichthys klamathensis goyatoka]